MIENCPLCKTDFTGAPIPKKDQKLFGGSTHFRRIIGIDGGMLGIYDGLVAYQCPDCKHEFPRGDSSWELELFEKYKKPEKRDPDFDPFKF